MTADRRTASARQPYPSDHRPPLATSAFLKKAPLALAMTTVLGGASLGSAFAAGVADWVGASGGEWGVATNWSTGRVPGATEQTYIYKDRVARVSDSGA